MSFSFIPLTGNPACNSLDASVNSKTPTAGWTWMPTPGPLLSAPPTPPPPIPISESLDFEPPPPGEDAEGATSLEFSKGMEKSSKLRKLEELQ